MIIIGTINIIAVLNNQTMIADNTYPTTNETIINIINDIGLIAAKYPLPSIIKNITNANSIVRISNKFTPSPLSYL